MNKAQPGPTRTFDSLVLILAEGLGAGRLPVAPGTWGSLVGLAWTALLLLPGSATVFLLGTAFLLLLAVPLCGRAEELLQRKDPSSVVLDEVAAVPLLFLFRLLMVWHGQGTFPALRSLLEGAWPALIAAGFVLFRVLDGLKPPPIGACQSLPGGWGVVADDVLAGLISGVIVAWVGSLL